MPSLQTIPWRKLITIGLPYAFLAGMLGGGITLGFVGTGAMIAVASVALAIKGTSVEATSKVVLMVATVTGSIVGAILGGSYGWAAAWFGALMGSFFGYFLGFYILIMDGVTKETSYLSQVVLKLRSSFNPVSTFLILTVSFLLWLGLGALLREVILGILGQVQQLVGG